MREGQEVYGWNDDGGTFELCPYEAASDYFADHEETIVQIYSGTLTKPKDEEFIEWMEDQNAEFYVDNVKPYAKFKYDEKNDEAIELDGEGK